MWWRVKTGENGIFRGASRRRDPVVPCIGKLQERRVTCTNATESAAPRPIAEEPRGLGHRALDRVDLTVDSMIVFGTSVAGVVPVDLLRAPWSGL